MIRKEVAHAVIAHIAVIESLNATVRFAMLCNRWIRMQARYLTFIALTATRVFVKMKKMRVNYHWNQTDMDMVKNMRYNGNRGFRRQI